MRYFKAKKGLFQLRYIYGKLRYPVHFVLTGFFCKSFIYKVLKGFFGVVYVHFIMLLLHKCTDSTTCAPLYPPNTP